MCRCEAHWTKGAPCTCSCLSHEAMRQRQTTAPDPTPDERVEPVARVLWRIDSSEYDYDWESNADTYRDEAREVLAAADATSRDARIRAEALREAAASMRRELADLIGDDMLVRPADVADDLEAQADAIEASGQS
jgi:hypothetical protein